MQHHKMSLLEKAVLVFNLLLLITGIVLYNINLPAFQVYIEEDGFVEWITVLGLLGVVFVCINRLFTLHKEKSGFFLFVTAMTAILFFFAAGEEISWGQRIFGIESSDFFKQNNAQQETNLHNLVVGGKKINKIIFSTVLSICLGIYFLIVPFLYVKLNKFKQFVNYSGIPVPRVYHAAAILVTFLLTEIIRDGKRAELLESGAALIFFLLLLYPMNGEIFKKKNIN